MKNFGYLSEKKVPCYIAKPSVFYEDSYLS